jgi:hypothetical protein
LHGSKPDAAFSDGKIFFVYFHSHKSPPELHTGYASCTAAHEGVKDDVPD